MKPSERAAIMALLEDADGAIASATDRLKAVDLATPDQVHEALKYDYDKGQIISKLDRSAVPFYESPNVGGSLNPKAIVMHYSASGSAEGTAEHFRKARSKASAHLVIGRDGSIIQCVDLRRVAWHAGRSSWNGRSRLNSWSIGIELVNWGPLARDEDGWRTWTGAAVSAKDVRIATHRDEKKERGWQTFPEAQMEAAHDICSALVSEFPAIDHILGHDDVSPNRKIDPGPAFPMLSFRAAILPERN